jgi:hypothetical protein
VRQISAQLTRSNTLASTAGDSEEMANDTVTSPNGEEKPGAIAPVETIDPETGLPELAKCKDGYKRCPICKVDKLMTEEEIERKNKAGNLNDVEVPDTLLQLTNANAKAPNPPLKRHKDFQHCLPPTEPKWNNKFALFTAGSIEMGAAIQWQTLLVKHLEDLPITICNPRRGTWDPQIQPKKGDPNFYEQVNWELNSLAKVDVIVFFFDCNTSSPITLLELGLWASSGKVIVCCDQRYWKQGNVEMVCERYNIPYVFSFHHLIPALKKFMALKGFDSSKGKCAEFPKEEARPKSTICAKKDMWWLEFQDTKEEQEAKKTRGVKDAEQAAKNDAKAQEEFYKAYPDQKKAYDEELAEKIRKNVENALIEGGP